ncbi:MAG: glycosyltransferase family 9 protein [Smithellaceae bacterium]
MNIQIPGIRFLQSAVPLKFDTDGTVKSILPVSPENNSLDTLFILSDLHYELFNLQAISEIKSYNTISLPGDFHFPVVFDGTQNLAGKKILLFMLTGWGDTILIEPAIRTFYKKIAASGKEPEITIAGNWINNFPYSQAPYIHNLCPNILSLNDLREFDVLVNFIPAHLQRSAEKSIQELFSEILHVASEKEEAKIPQILPAARRVGRIKPVLETIRKTTGKRLLCVNWLARFGHKNADAYLFAQILNRLNDYQAVIFHDKTNSAAIDSDIKKHKAPIINLSGYIADYHDTVAALSLVDAFISVDTGIVHAAGALRVPGVALFGPFPPETHVACYPSVIGLRANYAGSKCQGPCLETHRGCKEIDYRSEVISPCFQAFSPEDILKAFEKVLFANTVIEKKIG